MEVKRWYCRIDTGLAAGLWRPVSEHFSPVTGSWLFENYNQGPGTRNQTQARFINRARGMWHNHQAPLYSGFLRPTVERPSRASAVLKISLRRPSSISTASLMDFPTC